MIGNLATALEFNAVELKDCKSKVIALEEKVMHENTQEEVIKLLKKVAPQWAQEMDEMIDTVWDGRKRRGHARSSCILSSGSTGTGSGE